MSRIATFVCRSLLTVAASFPATSSAVSPAAVPAAVPANRQEPYWAGKDFWSRRHAAKLREIAIGPKDYDFVFVGDSITQNWEGWSETVDVEKATAAYEAGRLKFPNGPGRRVYEELKREFRLLNLGVAGDTTQQVLWRVWFDLVARLFMPQCHASGFWRRARTWTRRCESASACQTVCTCVPRLSYRPIRWGPNR